MTLFEYFNTVTMSQSDWSAFFITTWVFLLISAMRTFK
jgi:hypothetical protein